MSRRERIPDDISADELKEIYKGIFDGTIKADYESSTEGRFLTYKEDPPAASQIEISAQTIQLQQP